MIDIEGLKQHHEKYLRSVATDNFVTQDFETQVQLAIAEQLKRIADVLASKSFDKDNHNKMAAKIRDDYPDGWPDREQPYGFEGCYKLPDWLVDAARDFDVSRGFTPHPKET